MAEKVRASVTSVYSETTRRSVPEGCHLHTCRRENLKLSQAIVLCSGSPKLKFMPPSVLQHTSFSRDGPYLKISSLYASALVSLCPSTALVRDPAEVLPKVAYELGVPALNLVQALVFKRCILNSNTLVRA
jgi:hypothetical protein